MRAVLLTGLSFALTAAVIGNAYYQKKQFYPSVVYITKSNPSMAMLYIQAFVLVVLTGKLMRKIFFGQLRPAEMEHLIERSWYAVTETCLAFTVFRDDFSPRFVALFTLLLFLKCFHWLAEDRIDYMEQSPVIPILFHIRALTLMGLLAVLDLYFINHAYYSTLTKGASVQLVFGFEYAILLTIVMMTVMKYILHSIDLQSENPWENKAVYVLYTELVLGLIKVILYMAFMVIMIKIHTFPLFAIRPMYLSMRSFKKALHDVIMSRRAIRNMNTLYPDAVPEDLQPGDVCIICREEMNTSAKKLPCNHIFHTSCLRSWFQRQQTCPTCRMDVLRMPRPQTAPPPPQQPPQVPQQPQIPPNLFGGLPGMWPPMQPPQVPQAPPQHQASTATSVSASASSSQQQQQATQSTSTATVSSTFTHPTASMATPLSPSTMPPVMPMFPFMMPYGMPRPPSNPAGLSIEELQRMEGQERENIEARIQWLRDIQSLLDGAMILINQYNTVASQSSIPNINTSGSPQSQSNPVSQSSDKETSSQKEDNIEKSSLPKNDSNLDLSGLEGATGYTPPKEEIIPEWDDPEKEEHEDSMHEIRRRRIQKFEQQKSTEFHENHQKES
ncbi:hypothetical protein FSP39_013536 [Pinctada imbricata]|uniref:RING-type E3 ubiquitin transferase n=1 Tax=Pinctada imbricata TaxID=66713 RepID=A0AA88XWE4_PINIB|nr:hypothetical protein FSP39_013536 [Pinctada imbricata]